VNFELDDIQTQVRDLARTFAERELQPQAAELDATSRFPVETFRKLGELGLLAVNVPETYGGSELGTVALCVALQEVARACASTAVTMSVTNMVAEMIYRFGDEAQRKRHLPPLASGESVAGAFCLSEATSASDAASLRATARRDGDEWVLDGEKMWITSGAYAGVLIVMARTAGPEAGPRGISAFLVEPGAPGLSFGKPEHKMGLRGSNTVSVRLDGCRVPVGNLLGREGDGFKIAMTALDGGRITIGAMATGIARAALDAAASYALDRKAFGKPLARHQTIEHKLADMATQLDAGWLMVQRAAWLKERAGYDDTGATPAAKRFTREAAMAKLLATEGAKRVCDEAVQIHGGYGYTTEFPVERYYRDVRVTTIFEGTSEIQRLVIAREVLRQFAV